MYCDRLAHCLCVTWTVWLTIQRISIWQELAIWSPRWTHAKSKFYTLDWTLFSPLSRPGYSLHAQGSSVKSDTNAQTLHPACSQIQDRNRTSAQLLGLMETSMLRRTETSTIRGSTYSSTNYNRPCAYRRTGAKKKFQNF